MVNKMKAILCILFISFIVSCGPSRNSQGEYWKGYQVWHRITAKKEHRPYQPFLTRQQAKYDTRNN